MNSSKRTGPKGLPSWCICNFFIHSLEKKNGKTKKLYSLHWRLVDTLTSHAHVPYQPSYNMGMRLTFALTC